MEGPRINVLGMEKWQSENDRRVRHTQGLGFPLAFSPSLCCPASHHSVPFHLVEPLVPAGPSQDLPPPPLPTSLPASKAADSAAQDPIVVGEAAGLFAPEPDEKSQQSMANNTAGSFSIDPPSHPRAGSWAQVGRWRDAWGRLGIQPCPGAALQASLGLPTWGLGLREAEGLGWGSPGCQGWSDWASQSPWPPKGGRTSHPRHSPLGQDFKVHLTPSSKLYPGLQVSKRMFSFFATKD